jgi:hypothetical protein
MDEALLADYRASTYLVCMDRLRWTAIVLGQPLAPALQLQVGTRSWAFISAWNPGSVHRAEDENAAAQRQLLAAFERMTPRPMILPAVGVGASCWYEPSLFVAGPDFAAFDALGREHGQNAYLRGRDAGPADLHVLAG